MIARTPFRITLSAAMLTLLATQPAAQVRQCAEESFESASYVVCTIDPAASDLRLFWRNAAGKPYRSFSNVADAVRGQGRELVFAINAGMYRRDFSPVGLYVEDGQELQPADTTSIEGPPRQIPNFYKKPNGIFFLTATNAGLLKTDAFLPTRYRQSRDG